MKYFPPLLLSPASVAQERESKEISRALDSANSENVIALLSKLVLEDRQTVVLVTHDSTVADAATRVIKMRDGQIASDEMQAAATGVPAS